MWWIALPMFLRAGLLCTLRPVQVLDVLDVLVTRWNSLDLPLMRVSSRDGLPELGVASAVGAGQDLWHQLVQAQGF